MTGRDDDPAFAPTIDSGAGAHEDVAFAPTMDSPGVHASADPDAARRALTTEHPGRYHRREEIGRGGMGRVVLAFDEHLGREVALKELLAQSGGSKGAGVSVGVVARFLREARVTGQLEHPSIVPVYELGQRDDGTLYYTMKRIRGRSLASVLSEAKTLDARLTLLGHFRDVCEAMAYAHARGVVHRDLKPDNVMVGEFGETLVVDWGLAKVRGEDDPRATDIERRVNLMKGADAASTIDGHAIGTPAYMSPEQARGDLDAIDERSDVWGLGAMLFEILTGRPPHTGERAVEVLRRVLEERPPRVREVCPDAPAELAAVADRALLRDPSSRYPGAAQLAAEIAAFQDGRQVHAYEYSSLEVLRRFVVRHKAASIAALTVLVAVVTASGLVYGSYRSEAAARAIAESRRDQAVEQRDRADREALHAQVALAEALLDRAERALSEGDPAAAAVYAAGALVRHPANPHSPRHAELHLSAEDRRAADERVARAFSVYLDAEDARRFVFVRRIDGANLFGALSEDARLLVFPAGDDLTVLDVERDARRTLRDVNARRVLAFLDDERVAIAGDAPAVISLSDGQRLHALPPGVNAAAARAGRLAVITDAGAVHVLDAGTYAELGRIETPQRGRGEIAWAGEHLIVSGNGRAALDRWRWPAGAGADPEPESVALPSAPLGMDAAPSGRRVAVGLSDPAVVVATVEPFAVEQALGAAGWVTDVAWIDDALLLSAENDEQIVLRNVGSGRILDTLHCPESAGQRVVTGGRRRTVVALPAPDAHRIPRASMFRWERSRARRIRPLGESVRYVLTDPRRQRVVAATLRSIFAMETQRDGLGEIERIGDVPPSAGYPVTMAVASDGALGVVTSTGTVLLYEPGTIEPRVVAEHAAPNACLFGVAFGRAGDVLYAGDERGRVRRWRRSRQRALPPLEGHEGSVCGMSMSSDGSRLATASLDGTVRLWDVERGETVTTIDRPDVAATAVAFDPSGERLAVADDEGTVSVHRRSDGEELWRFRAHSDWINRLAWSPDARRIATAADDRTVRVFSADGERIVRIVRTESVPLSLDLSSRGTYLYHHDGVDVVRLAVEPPVDARDPEALLRVAERRGGIRLDGLDIVPSG